VLKTLVVDGHLRTCCCCRIVFTVKFLARDVIYTSRAYATMSVSVGLSVTEVHWRIIVNLGFKFRSQFTAHCGHGVREGIIAGKSGGIK